MPLKLSTTIGKIQKLPNSSNAKIINEFLTFMKNNGSPERHQNNNLNVIIEKILPDLFSFKIIEKDQCYFSYIR